MYRFSVRLKFVNKSFLIKGNIINCYIWQSIEMFPTTNDCKLANLSPNLALSYDSLLPFSVILGPEFFTLPPGNFYGMRIFSRVKRPIHQLDCLINVRIRLGPPHVTSQKSHKNLHIRKIQSSISC